MRALFVPGLVLGPAARRPGAPDEAVPDDGWNAAARARCVTAGGTPTAGLAGPACAMPTPDADRSCSTSDDCAGFCLAKTRTCSPETSYFGCHATGEGGDKVALCIDETLNVAERPR